MVWRCRRSKREPYGEGQILFRLGWNFVLEEPVVFSDHIVQEILQIVALAAVAPRSLAAVVAEAIRWSNGTHGGQANVGGGGGGSFNSGTNQNNQAGANAGHGKVVITLISSTSTESGGG